MKASDLFVAQLEEEDVEYIFGLPGEENLDLLESLQDFQNQTDRNKARTGCSVYGCNLRKADRETRGLFFNSWTRSY